MASRAESLRAKLIGRGFPEHIADGFVMNFQDESGLDAGVNEVSPTVAGSRGGFGLYQLTGPRRRAYEDFAAARGVQPSDEDAQLDFLVQELGSTESAALEALKGTSTAGEAGAVIVNDFLRPAQDHRERRAAKYLGQSVNPRAEGGASSGGDQQDWSPVHNAYLSGQMSPEQQEVYKSSLASGEITAMPAPSSVYDAYTSGLMNEEQRAQFDAAVSSGIWAIPEQTEPQKLDKRTFGQDLLRQLGLTARAGAEGAAGLLGIAADPVAALMNMALEDENKIPYLREGVSQLLTDAGVPEPETTTERIVQAASQAMVGAGGTVAAARGAGALATGELGSNVAGQLAAQPLAQVAGGLGSGAASQGAAEAGGGTGAQLAAGLAGGVLGAGSVAGRVPKGNARASEVADIAAGDAAGIRVLTSDIAPPTSFSAKTAQRAGERVPIAGTGGVRAAQQAERIGAVRKLADKFGATSIDEMSDDLVADVIGKRRAAFDKLSTAKREVVSGAKGVVPVKRTLAALDEEIAKQNAIGTAGSKAIANKLTDWRKSLEGKTLDVVDDIRSEMGAAFNGDDMASVRSAAQKVMRRIYGPLKQDMGDHITRTSGKPAFNKWAVTNEKLSKMIGEVENSGLKAALKRGEANPEAIAKMLFSPNRSNVKALFKGLSPEGRERAKSAIIWKLTRDGTQELSPERFASQVNKLGGNVGVFFSGKDLEAVRGLERAIRVTRRAGEASLATNSGQQLAQAVTGLGGVGIGAMSSGGVGAATAVGAIGLAGLAARAYESPAVRNILIKISQSKTGSAEEAALIKRAIAAAQSYEQEAK